MNTNKTNEVRHTVVMAVFALVMSATCFSVVIPPAYAAGLDQAATSPTAIVLPLA